MTYTILGLQSYLNFCEGEICIQDSVFSCENKAKQKPAMFVICNYTNLLHRFICTATNLYPTHWFNPLAKYLAIKQIMKQTFGANENRHILFPKVRMLTCLQIIF